MNRFTIRVTAALCSFLVTLAATGSATAHGDAQIAVSPNPAAAGSKITVEGSDFDENEEVSLVLEAVTGEAVLGKIMTDEKGDFHFETDLPASAAAGSYRVRAESSDVTAFADLSVTAAGGAVRSSAVHGEPIGFHEAGSTSEVIVLSIVLASLAVVGLGLLFWRERSPA